MSEKIYVRKVERFTQWASSEPIEIDVEKLRECEPPYEGNTNEELMMYLKDNVYQNFDWFETNQEKYENAYDLTFDDTELEVILILAWIGKNLGLKWVYQTMSTVKLVSSNLSVIQCPKIIIIGNLKTKWQTSVQTM